MMWMYETQLKEKYVAFVQALLVSVLALLYTAIHKVTGLTDHGLSMTLPGIIPKISKGAAIQNGVQRPFCTAVL